MHPPTLRASDEALPDLQRQEKSVAPQLMVFAALSKQGIAQGGSCATRLGKFVAVAFGVLGAVAMVTLEVVEVGNWPSAGEVSPAIVRKTSVWSCIMSSGKYPMLE